MAIFLIRHGETDSNARQIIQNPDTPLSARGMEQATRLGHRLADAGVTRILSSDLARAAMTADCVQAATGAPVAHDALLHERNFGDLRGREYEAVGIDIFAPGYAPPAGETWEVFHRRVGRAWESIRRALAGLEGHLAVVTHGLVCRVLTERHLTLPDGWARPDGWANTSLTTVDATPPWQVRLLNCTAHLDDDPPDSAASGF